MPASKKLLDVFQRAQPAQLRSRRMEVRLTEAEEQLFKLAAKARGVEISEWLRACGREGAKHDLIASRARPRVAKKG